MGRFIPKLGERALPFFKLMKKKGPFEWTPEADRAFQDLKSYLTSPPVMVAPRPLEPLVLYIAATPYSASATLVAVREEHQAKGASCRATPPAEMTQDQEGAARAVAASTGGASLAGRRHQGPDKRSSVGGSITSGDISASARHKHHQRATPRRAPSEFRQHGVAGRKGAIPHAPEAFARALGGLA